MVDVSVKVRRPMTRRVVPLCDLHVAVLLRHPRLTLRRVKFAQRHQIF